MYYFIISTSQHPSSGKCYHGYMANEVSSEKQTHAEDRGPFYHGTIADLNVGDELTAGFKSNYRPAVTMNHIYFTALVDGAGLAAEIAEGLSNGARHARVYIVKPTGEFEDDPNVTNKKFPGNPTCSYRTREPLKIIGEVVDWKRLTPEELKDWLKKNRKCQRRYHQLARPVPAFVDFLSSYSAVCA